MGIDTYTLSAAKPATKLVDFNGTPVAVGTYRWAYRPYYSVFNGDLNEDLYRRKGAPVERAWDKKREAGVALPKFAVYRFEDGATVFPTRRIVEDDINFGAPIGVLKKVGRGKYALGLAPVTTLDSEDIPTADGRIVVTLSYDARDGRYKLYSTATGIHKISADAPVRNFDGCSLAKIYGGYDVPDRVRAHWEGFVENNKRAAKDAA